MTQTHSKISASPENFPNAGTSCVAPQTRALACTKMCHSRARGTNIPSFQRNAGLTRKVVAVEENNKNPPVTTTQKPIQFQANKSSRSCAAVSRFFPKPSSRKSSARFVPSQMDSPVKWINCVNGYAQSEVRTPIPHGVPSSHFAKPCNSPYISSGLSSREFPALGEGQSRQREIQS